MENKGFEGVAGHREIIDYMKNAVTEDNISHAYILNGEKGAGKKLLAGLFALSLDCMDRQEGFKPCYACASCKKMLGDNHPDVTWVTHEKPTSIGVSDIRAQVVDDIDIKPFESAKKIYIIPEADKMTPQAQNALLKTIEEPPAYVVIFLLTENMETLLDTVKSRCVVLNLRNIKDSLIKDYLIANYAISDYEAGLCTAFAQGNMGRAITLATSEHFNEIKEEALRLLRHISAMELSEVIEALKRISEYKMDIIDYLDLFLVWYRDVLYYKATKDINGVVFNDQRASLKEQAEVYSYEGLEDIIAAVRKAKMRLKANVNFDLAIELLYLTIRENR